MVVVGVHGREVSTFSAKVRVFTVWKVQKCYLFWLLDTQNVHTMSQFSLGNISLKGEVTADARNTLTT